MPHTGQSFRGCLQGRRNAGFSGTTARRPRETPLHASAPQGWVLAERADDAGGIAKSKAARRQVVRDDAAGTDDASVADRDPGQDDRAAADPDAVADADRAGIFEPGGTGRAVERVGRG